MSHFVALVIGPNVEEQLQPYHEFECTGVDDEYVVDVDITEELHEEYETGTGVNEEPHKQRYRSIEEYAKDWCGYEFDGVYSKKEEGRFYKHTNPNAQWDWWVIGGRWSGWLGRDQGKKREFDFDMLRATEAKTAGEQYDSDMKLVEGIPMPSETWGEIRERLGVKEARKNYNNNLWIKKLNSTSRWFGQCPVEAYREGREAYITKKAAEAIVPYALVIEGQWQSKGEMDWFGTSSNDMPDEDWAKHVNTVLERLPEDTLITVVDCHI